MEMFIPDIYKKSIYTIDYDALIKRGIKCILFDLDNTLVPLNVKTPNKKIQDLFENLKSKTTVILFTNADQKRLDPFIQSLKVDGYSKVTKNFSKKLVEVMSKYNLRINEVAIIGDEIINDIYNGNMAGITTVLVNPVSKQDDLKTKILKRKENKIIKELRNKDLFMVGRYYE